MRNSIPSAVYLGCVMSDGKLYLAIVDFRGVLLDSVTVRAKKDSAKGLIRWVRNYAKKNYVKIIAVGVADPGSILSEEQTEELFSKLWLEEDMVPIKFLAEELVSEKVALDIARGAAGEFEKERVVGIKLEDVRRVDVHQLARLSDYEKFAGKESMKELSETVEELKRYKERIVFFSSTPRGGGVALMRHSLVRLARLSGVDIRWHVMHADEQVFSVTKKKFHNILQGVSDSEDRLTQEDKEVYSNWIKKNVDDFRPLFKEATTIIIDDPQPSGMIPYIKKENPDIKIIYRSHIQIDAPLLMSNAEAQKETWEFLWPNIMQADVFVSHPIPEFVPHTVPEDKVVWMPATTDELDGLNKPLNKIQMDYYYGVLNDYLKEHSQTPLDTNRSYIVQVARFDPSKGIPDLVAVYRIFREMLERDGYKSSRIPQLVIAGHGAIDDPEGQPIFDETLDRVQTDLNRKYVNDVKVARVEHSDQLLNAILSGSMIALQLSHKEGFEVKVSEALAKGKPVVAYKTGGIVLQVEDGETGYLVSTGETQEVAQRLYELFTNKKLYQKMSKNAAMKVNKEFFTIENTLRWMNLVLRVREGGSEVDYPSSVEVLK